MLRRWFNPPHNIQIQFSRAYLELFNPKINLIVKISTQVPLKKKKINKSTQVLKHSRDKGEINN